MNNWVNESLSTEQLIVNGINEIWVKRDDLIHPIISGNKWRKLKYVLTDAISKDINHIVTYGGAYSNHALATACACANFNLKCSIIVRGEEPQTPNHYTLLQKAFGARLIYISRTDYNDKVHAISFAEYNPKETMVIPEGGAHTLAYKGCAEIISSLTQKYDYLFLASGTGTTALGIAQEMDRLKINTKLIVAPVLKNGSEIQDLLEEYSFCHVLSDSHLGGYAKTIEKVFTCINRVLKTNGIILDPVYTAKSYLAMQNYLEAHKLKNKRILFLHTGGQLGLFSQPMLSKWSGSI